MRRVRQESARRTALISSTMAAKPAPMKAKPPPTDAICGWCIEGCVSKLVVSSLGEVSVGMQRLAACTLLCSWTLGACSRPTSEREPPAAAVASEANARPAHAPAALPTANKAPAPVPQASAPAAPAPAAPASSAPAPTAPARKPRVRTLHPQPGASECVEMYGSCTPEPDSVCTTEAFVLACDERGKHPKSGAALRCLCP